MTEHTEKVVESLPKRSKFWKFIKEETSLLLTDGDCELLERNIEDLKRIKKELD